MRKMRLICTSIMSWAESEANLEHAQKEAGLRMYVCAFEVSACHVMDALYKMPPVTTKYADYTVPLLHVE